MGNLTPYGVALEDSAAGQPLKVCLNVPDVTGAVDVACPVPVAGNLPYEWKPMHLANIDEVAYGISPIQGLRVKLGFTLPKVTKAINPYEDPVSDFPVAASNTWVKPLLVPTFEQEYGCKFLIDDKRPKLTLGFIKPTNTHTIHGDLTPHIEALGQVAECLGEVAAAIPEPPSSESGIFNVEMGGHIIKYKPTQVNYNHEYNGEKTVDIKGIVVDHGNTL